MRLRLLTLAASALIVSGSIALAQQQTAPDTTTQQQGQGMMGQGMMGQGMMGRGMGHMMGRGRGHGMHRGPGMRIMFILMDTDGDGALSLEEIQSAHARIFKAVDTSGDGKVTYEEMVAFFRGGPRPAQGQDDEENDNDQ